MELLSLIPLIGFALAWQRWQRTTSASAVLHAVAAMLIVLFIASLVGMQLPATVLLMTIGTTLAVIEGYRLYVCKAIIPPPIGIFALLCSGYWFIHSGSAYFYYDEYSHWGVFLREVLAHNQLWGADSNAMHPRYLPGTSLWQSFFAVFSRHPEGAAYLAQFALLITPLLVLWEKIAWRQFAWHAGILLLVIVAISNFGNGFTSLYVDHLLGVWFAGILLNYILEMNTRTRWQLASYALPLIVVVTIKTTGVFFVLAALGTITFLAFASSAADVAGRAPIARFGRALAFPLATLALCIIVLSTWNLNRSAAGMATFESSATGVVSKLLDGESIFDSVQQAELTQRFIKVVLHQQISKDETSAQYNAFSYPLMSEYEDRFRLTTVSLMGVSLITIFLLWRTIVPSEFRRIWAIAAGCVWFAAVLYIVALYFGYRYVSATENGLVLSSYIRYAHSMLLPVVVFCFVPLLPAFAGNHQPSLNLWEKISVGRHTMIFFVALAALIFFEPPYLEPLYSTQSPPAFRTETEPTTDRLRARIGQKRLWIFFPTDLPNGMLGQILKYQLTPGPVHIERDANVLLQNPATLIDELRNWEYLWLIAGDPLLDAAAEAVVSQDLADRLFRIDSDGDDIRFVAVTGVFD